MRRAKIIFLIIIISVFQLFFHIKVGWAKTVFPRVPRSIGVFAASPRVLRTPEYRFENLKKIGYPWDPTYFTLSIQGMPPLRMHFLDLGPKNATETILLLHGEPTWSYLYRKMIPPLLRAGYRVVAPDFIGFGRSDKLARVSDYSHDLHVQSLQQLVQYLDLKNLTLHGVDYGGPVGLSVVRRNKNLFSRLVLFNTFVPEGDYLLSPSLAIRAIPLFLARGFVQSSNINMPVGLVMSALTNDNVTKSDLSGYTAPFPNPFFQAGPASWGTIQPGTPTAPMAEEMRRVRKFIEEEWSGPTMHGFSDRYLFTDIAEYVMRDLFGGKCKVKISDAGTFIPEEKGEFAGKLVVDYIEKGQCGPIRRRFSFG